MKIKKGDSVTILLGKDRGKTGKVEKTYPKVEKILIQGMNIYKKHLKSSKRHPHGGIIDINHPVKVSNVMLVCPRCNKMTRVGYKITKNDKLRVCKKCKESVDVKA